MIAGSGFTDPDGPTQGSVAIVGTGDTPGQVRGSTMSSTIVYSAAAERTITATYTIDNYIVSRRALRELFAYAKDDLPRIPEFWELPPKIPPARIRPRGHRRFRTVTNRVIFQPCWRAGRWRSVT